MSAMAVEAESNATATTVLPDDIDGDYYQVRLYI